MSESTKIFWSKNSCCFLQVLPAMCVASVGFFTAKSSLYGSMHRSQKKMKARAPRDFCLSNTKWWICWKSVSMVLCYRLGFQRFIYYFKEFYSWGKLWNYMTFDEHHSTGLQPQARLESGNFMQCFWLDPPRRVSFNGTIWFKANPGS